MARRRVYDAADIATSYVTTFKDRPVEEREQFDFSWPSRMQHVGDSVAVAYESDKWKAKKNGRRQGELYKHLAESRNTAYCVPGLLGDYYESGRDWPVIGPGVDMSDWPMPTHVAMLGRFEEADLDLYTRGTDSKPRFGPADNFVKVTVGHGYLGASKILWSERDPDYEDEVFLFVYTRRDGVLMIIVGEQLDIEKDGIVG